MRAPAKRRASTKSPIGRSCIRATPCSQYSPPKTAKAAVSGRNAVPALPKNKSASVCGKRPFCPTTCRLPARCSSGTPSCASASSIRSVSSDLSREWMSHSLSDRAASSSVRLLMLLEPGRATVLCGFRVRGCRRIASVMAFSAVGLGVQAAFNRQRVRGRVAGKRLLPAACLAIRWFRCSHVLRRPVGGSGFGSGLRSVAAVRIVRARE